MSYAVEVLDEVKAIDMPKLLDIDRALGRVVAELVRDLHDPWLGREMRERMRPVQPNNGSIAVITVRLSAHAKACWRTNKRRRASAHNSDKGVSRFSNQSVGPT